MELNKENIAEYILAGNSTITIMSEDTGNRFTYKITQSTKNENLYYIKLLIGDDNESDYRYIGCYYADTEVFIAVQSWKDCLSVIAIKYLFSKLYNKPNKLHAFSSERCARCGRKLTTPDSSTRLYGPECIKYVYK